MKPKPGGHYPILYASRRGAWVHCQCGWGGVSPTSREASVAWARHIRDVGRKIPTIPTAAA